MRMKDMTAERVADAVALLFDDVSNAVTDRKGDKRIRLVQADRTGRYVKRCITVTIRDEDFDV